MRNILLEQKFPDNRKEGSIHRQVIAGGLFFISMYIVHTRLRRTFVATGAALVVQSAEWCLELCLQMQVTPTGHLIPQQIFSLNIFISLKMILSKPGILNKVFFNLL